VRHQPPHPETGRAIREAREQLGWTQADLAERAILADGTIQAAEAGGHIKAKTHKTIVDTLNRFLAQLTPPRPPVEIPYPSKTAASNAAKEANEPAAPYGKPITDPLENPHLLAIFEALRHTAPRSLKANLRIGVIRSKAELHNLWAIDNQAYPDGNITFEHFLELWEAFPTGLHVLFHENEIMGAIGIWPVTRGWAEKLKAARLKEAQLDGRMVQMAARGPANLWYVTGLMLRPELIGRGGGVMRLLNSALTSWLEKADHRYPSEILALAYSAHGSRMLDRFRFHIIQHSENMPDKLDLYGLILPSRNELLRLLRERNLSVK
jgi:transcriptional regulator with XRE-family HTH domain